MRERRERRDEEFQGTRPQASRERRGDE